MMDHETVNILLVDDQPAKLLAYEVILKELGENLIVAASGREALEVLLKKEIIFISAIQVSDLDRLRGYEMGAVDYVPVPVVPEVLRAKIKVFCELYRKTRQL